MLLLVLQEMIEWKWMTDFLGNYQTLNQHFSLAVRVKKNESLDKTQSWPELEHKEDVHLKTQFTYLGLLPKINSLCQVAISAVYYHRHLALNRPPESECILTSLILVVSSVNFILGLLTCFSNWNTIKNSYWAKLLSGIFNLFFSVWMPLDIGLDILMNSRYYNQSPDWNQQLSNTSNKICNQTVLEEQWENVISSSLTSVSTVVWLWTGATLLLDYPAYSSLQSYLEQLLCGSRQLIWRWYVLEVDF